MAAPAAADWRLQPPTPVAPFEPTSEEYLASLENQLRSIERKRQHPVRADSSSRRGAAPNAGLARELESLRAKEQEAAFVRHVAVSRDDRGANELVDPLFADYDGAQGADLAELAPAAETTAVADLVWGDGCALASLARCMVGCIDCLPTREPQLRAVWKSLRALLVHLGARSAARGSTGTTAT